MRIEVYKDWIIRTNKGDKGYTLCKSAGMATRKDEKTGVETEYETFKSETYPSSITSCLRVICKQELIDSRVTTFKGFQKEVDKLESLLAKIGKELREDDLLKMDK